MVDTFPESSKISITNFYYIYTIHTDKNKQWIRYDTIEEFNMDSKAKLNLAHVARN